MAIYLLRRYKKEAMSSGKIKKSKNSNLPNDLINKPIHEVIYQVVQTCDVEVDNSEWQQGDKQLEQKLTSTNNKLAEIENKIGNSSGVISHQIESIRQEIEDIRSKKPIEVAVKIDENEIRDLGLQHSQFPLLLQILSTKLNTYLVGPAGSGKTTAAINCAKALKVSFHFTGAIASEFKLTGFIDAQGRIVSTEFRKAYENGGLFLFDEIDASYPQAVLAFNAALANDYMDFPDKTVERHKDFYCIAAANTFGQGADRQYVGRNQLDAASLDRFVFLDWKYDENLERKLACDDNWVNFVQKVRQIVEELRIRHIVSPRASIFGAKLLAQNIEKSFVENITLWKGLDNATVNKIKENLNPIKDIVAQHAGIFTPSKSISNNIKSGDILGIITDRNGYNQKQILATCDGIITEISKRADIQQGAVIAKIKLI